MAEMMVVWTDLDWVLVWNFLGEFLEKGNTRKHTKNRVARCRKLFGGILGGFTLFCEGNVFGGI
jgi:hypothetical protein